MMFEIFFFFWRFLEVITLIPIVGLLAYFVDGYNKLNALTPTYILVLFIVSILACAWALFTLLSAHRSRSNGSFIAFIDLLFVGAFIAAVYELRFITDADCASITPGSRYDATLGAFGYAATVSGVGVDVRVDKSCAMLKAAFALGIVNAILFFFTAVLAYLHGSDRHGYGRGDKITVVRETHVHRHGNRSPRVHSHSRRGSHHSHRRAYV
ncbi:hypothetical protein F5Y17DRAFT_38892 [Xylariaceae sp. FL0594]|nr:hypothetical protein F5Y17DRAFT_38892 [Xylariaceae sp. FL0594]